MSDTEVYRIAVRQADELRETTKRECEALRHETDEYVDTRLANFEITLNKTLEAVSRGRDRLPGAAPLDQESLDTLAGLEDTGTIPPPLPSSLGIDLRRVRPNRYPGQAALPGGRRSVVPVNGSSTAMRLDPRSPFVINTHELGRRPGSMRTFELTVPAPADLGIELLGVPEGSPVELDLRLERSWKGCSRPDGVGHAHRGVRTVPGADRGRPRGLAPGAVRLSGGVTPRRTRRSRLDGELFDLEPVLRDAVVLALPFQPVCRADCPGLCVECGARLADHPGHAPRGEHRPPVGRARRPDHSDTDRRSRIRAGETRRSNRGCSEAEDVAQQHAPPPVAVEGCCPVARDVRQPGLPAPSTCRTAPAPSADSTARALTVVRSSDVGRRRTVDGPPRRTVLA